MQFFVSLRRHWTPTIGTYLKLYSGKKQILLNINIYIYFICLLYTYIKWNTVLLERINLQCEKQLLSSNYLLIKYLWFNENKTEVTDCKNMKQYN